MTEFTERYKKLSDDELLAIIADASSYKPIALEAAKQELMARGTPEDHLVALEAQNVIDTKEKETLLQKRKEEREDSKKAFFALFDTVNPFLKQLESHERLIRIMSWVFTLISLYIIKTLILPLFHYYDLIIIYSDHLFEIDEWKIYVLLYSVCIILTTLGTILFWKRKTLGWVLITLYIVSSVLGLLFILVINVLKPWRQFYRIVDEFMMSDLLISYSLYVVFLVFSLYVLFKGKVKKVFKVTKIVANLTVLAAIIFQALAWYTLIYQR